MEEEEEAGLIMRRSEMLRHRGRLAEVNYSLLQVFTITCCVMCFIIIMTLINLSKLDRFLFHFLKGRDISMGSCVLVAARP